MIHKFIDYIKIEKRSSVHTVRSYTNDMLQFETYCIGSFEINSDQASHQVVRSWVLVLMEEGLSERSVNRKLSTLRSYFKFLIRIDQIQENPMNKVSGPKTKKRLPVIVEESKMDELFESNNFSSNFEGARDHLLLDLLYQTGMRQSELINLKEKDISDRGLKVLGKRNKERIIPIQRSLEVQIQSYISTKREKALSKNEYLLVTNKGNKLYEKFVFRTVNKYLQKVTSATKRSPHILRHTFATHMLNNGASIESIRDVLGHASLTATQVYTHNSINKLKRVHAQAHPRGANA